MLTSAALPDPHRHAMNMPINLTWYRSSFSRYSVVFLALLVSACGEFAYKRGASSSDLENAKKSCKAKDPDPVALEKCMADNGWTIQNLSKMEPIDADPVIEATVIPSNQRIENASSAPNNKKSPGEHVLSSTMPPTQPAKKMPDMLDTFKVSSWWKAGSGADSLKADTEACVAKLGEAHRPNIQTQSATRGLLLCMKEKGWSGLRAK